MNPKVKLKRFCGREGFGLILRNLKEAGYIRESRKTSRED